MSHDAGFDARVRAVHDASLERLSPRVQAQLAQRRRAALQGTHARRVRGLLPWAGVATAGLALALVVQLRPPGIAPRAAPPVASATAVAPARPPAAPVRAEPARAVAVDTRMASRADADAIAPDLTQDPEFYLWLGDTRPTNAE
jgi:hypothetical protein